MNIRKGGVSALVAASVLLACSGRSSAKELTRSKAKELIQRSPSFSITETVPTSNLAFNVAQAAGMWKSDPNSSWWVPSREGAALFRSITLTVVTLVKPLHRTVTEVTGITEGLEPNVTKVAEFKWYFNDLAEPVARYTGATTADHDGHAALRLYDDGWRIEDITVGLPFAGGNPRPFAAGERSKPPDDLTAAKITLANIRALVAVWNCLIGGDTDLKYGFAFDGNTSAQRRNVRVDLLRQYAHQQGCWNVPGEVPTRDGWGEPFELSVWGGAQLSRTDRGFRIRSAGSDGIFQSASYTKGTKSPGLASDIVWETSGSFGGHGDFVQRPRDVTLPLPCNPPQGVPCIPPK